MRLGIKINYAKSQIKKVVLLICFFLVVHQARPYQSETPNEYQIKAVFLFNFIQFVEWPQDAFIDESAPFTIGVLGEDPFGPVLDEIVTGEIINGRPIEIHRYSKVSEIDQCHLLFISASEIAHSHQTLELLKQKQILTVSDTQDFAEAGGMIGFKTVQNKIKLLINLESAKGASLDISSKLLRLSKIVTTKRS